MSHDRGERIGHLWIGRLRMRLAIWLVGIGLACIGSIAWAGLPLLPALGFAVAAAAVTVSSASGRLSGPVCLACGKSLRDESPTPYGIECPGCGAIHQARPKRI